MTVRIHTENVPDGTSDHCGKSDRQQAAEEEEDKEDIEEDEDDDDEGQERHVRG